MESRYLLLLFDHLTSWILSLDHVYLGTHTHFKQIVISWKSYLQINFTRFWHFLGRENQLNIFTSERVSISQTTATHIHSYTFVFVVNALRNTEHKQVWMYSTGKESVLPRTWDYIPYWWKRLVAYFNGVASSLLSIYDLIKTQDVRALNCDPLSLHNGTYGTRNVIPGGIALYFYIKLQDSYV